MSLNGGLGAVISKNQVLISDKLNVGKLASVKHANGRDWWLVTHKAFSDKYYKLLVTPNGISTPIDQTVGINMPADAGQVAFSPDGSKHAYYYPNTGVQILDFDRCSGMFSNPIYFAINDSATDGGIAFSPSSQVLYVSSILKTYQFDLTATDINASKMIVAIWDSFLSPTIPPLATYFFKF